MIWSHEQHAALDSTADDLLIIAGPGSGKTTLLAALINTRLAAISSNRAVLITYTNEAARHLRFKLSDRHRPRFIGTLHAWALYEITTATRETWTVIDDTEAADRLRAVADELRYSDSMSAARAAILSDNIGTSATVVAAAYRNRMLAARMLDFDLILYLFRDLLKKGMVPPVSLLAVDEYQDTAPIDAEIYDLITWEQRIRVGDPDQAVYGFRGATIENIINAAKSPATEVLFLTLNWRSVPLICDAATHLIGYNSNRIEKATVSGQTTAHKGTIAILEPFSTAIAEAAAIAEMVQRSRKAGHSVAVLARTNAAVGILAAAIPNAETDKAQPTAQIAILAAALNALIDPHNEEAARPWLRHLETSDKRFKACQQASGLPRLHYALKTCTPNSCDSMILPALRTMKVPQIAILWAKQAGVTVHAPAIEFQRELSAVLRDAEAEAAAQNQGVTVTTFHGSKGREFDHVIIAAAEQELTPGQKKGDELEEERRLFYVALTRARIAVTITRAETRPNAFAGGALENHTATRFLAELPA